MMSPSWIANREPELRGGEKCLIVCLVTDGH